MNTIKVGYLISYDYEFVKNSLPRVYDYVSEIVFAVDKDRLTWSGQSFEIKDDFWDWIKTFDTAQKIRIYEDRFYLPELSPMECDTRERNMLGQQMGKADWYVQIDSDEYFADFESFVKKLEVYMETIPTSIYCSVVTVFKEVNGGYLLIDDSFETLSFATNKPVYDLARNNTSGNKHIHFDDLVLHQSWARSPEEIKWKLDNWSHKNDFNTESFFKLWSAVDEFNFYCLSNFHPLHPVSWPGLKMINGSISEILNSKELTSFRHGSKPGVKKKNVLSRIWKEIRS